MSPAVTAEATALMLIGQEMQTLDSARHSSRALYMYTSLFLFHNHALAKEKWQPGCLTRALGPGSRSQKPILYAHHVYL